MLVVTALAATLFIPPAWLSNLSLQTALSAFLGFSNWTMQLNATNYFAPRAEFNPFTHTWSLGIEEQFYLVCPLVLFVWLQERKANRRGWWVLLLTGSVGLLSFGASMASSRANPLLAFYAIQCRLWELAAGVLLYLCTSTATRPRNVNSASARDVAGWIGLVLVILAAAFADPAGFPFPWVIPVTTGTVLMIGGARVPGDRGPRMILASSVAVWIGKRSYSLYLWHWPVFVLMRWTVGLDTFGLRLAAVFFSFVAATVSYAVVEQPLRHHHRVQAWHPVLQITLFVVIVVVGRTTSQNIFSRAESIGLSVVSRNRAEWLADGNGTFVHAARTSCAVDAEAAEFENGTATLFKPVDCQAVVARHTIFVIGDSHAGAFSPLLRELVAQEGVTVRLFSRPGCPHIGLLQPKRNNPTPGCADFSKGVGEYILKKGSAIPVFRLV